MNDKLKMISCTFAGIMIGGLTVVGANQAIQAIQNTNIKISLNGVIQEFKDETTGEIQYPITYNDRTYLPLRNVAQLSGLVVDYDSSTNTAILTNKNEQKTDNQTQKTNNKTGTFFDVRGNGYLGISDSEGAAIDGYINYNDSIVKNTSELFAITDYTIEYKINDDKTISIIGVQGISNEELKTKLSEANKNDSKKLETEGIGKFSIMQDDNYVVIEGIANNSGTRGYVDYGSNESVVSSTKELFDIYNKRVGFKKYDNNSVVIVKVYDDSEILEEKDMLISENNIGYIESLDKKGNIVLITDGKKVKGTVNYNGDFSMVSDYDNLMDFYEKDLKYSVYQDDVIVITGNQKDVANTSTGVIDRLGLDGGVVIKGDKGGLVGTGVDYDKSIVKNEEELKGLIGKRVKYIWAEADKLTITRVLDLEK